MSDSGAQETPWRHASSLETHMVRTGSLEDLFEVAVCPCNRRLDEHVLPELDRLQRPLKDRRIVTRDSAQTTDFFKLVVYFMHVLVLHNTVQCRDQMEDNKPRGNRI